MPKEDTKSEQTEFRQCRICGRTILQRLPKGLKGEFEHIRCRREEGDSILDAAVIG